tara:strand:- start:4016 stop:4189 length:174 start_codon:yes stop_codon:yes gene_type:complete
MIDNKEWLFSGVGVFAITVIISIITSKKRTIKQTQKSGSNSTNYQSSGDINIGSKDD